MHSPAANPGKLRRWLRRAVILFVALFAVQAGINFWLEKKRLGAWPVHLALVKRLEATFGRDVDVGYFQLGLFGRPRVEANFVTVAEDPRFGHEHFLRAERLEAGLRWRALLRGRIELGTIAVTRPSLNLVRNSAGEWNLLSWLPQPAPDRSFVGPEDARRGRIFRIEVEGGRVNLKQGANKHPFALVELEGTVEQESPGRWRVDLESQLMRSTVALQETGTIRVRGSIGGTTERLRPAELQVIWDDASLADWLRLAYERDFGVRGAVNVDFTARTEAALDAPWEVSGVARLRGVHRWDLPPRATDPALNVAFDASVSTQAPRVELTRAEIDAPGSSVRGAGHFDWGASPPDLDLRLTSAGIALSDLFSWYRAFRPGVPGNVALEGNSGLSLHLTGWPPRMEQAVWAAQGTQLRVPGGGTLSLGNILIRSERGVLTMAPVGMDWATAAGAAGQSARRADASSPGPALRLEGTAVPAQNRIELKLAGRVERPREALATLAALGWTRFSGWEADGSAAMQLAWRGTIAPFATEVTGNIEPRRLSLRPPFLLEPVILAEGRVELAPGVQSVRVGAADAFGARWSGLLTRRSADSPWDFILAADRLDLAEMRRWFIPEQSPGFLSRLAAPPPAPSNGALLEARGRVQFGQVILGPLVAQRVRAQADLVGLPWNLRLADVQADFYGGALGGTLRAEGGAVPAFRFAGRLQRVKLDSIAEAAPGLTRVFAGLGSAELNLEARGRDRTALLDSLAGSGTAQATGVQIRGMDLLGWLQVANPEARPAANSAFASAEGSFALARRSVRIESLRLNAPRAEIELAGSVGFDHALDLQARRIPPRLAGGVSASADPAPQAAIRITGTLGNPQVVRLDAAPR